MASAHPNFAVVYSFLEKYGQILQLPDITMPELCQYLDDNKKAHPSLVDIHVKLMRKLTICKCVSYDRWEKSLLKVTREFSDVVSWELEQFGYCELKGEIKTEILKNLCEYQFDDNIKFKLEVNKEEPELMRYNPLGRDKKGLVYWYQQDHELNIHVYREEQDDVAGESWELVCSDREDLAGLVMFLRSGLDGTKPEEESDSEKTESSVSLSDGKQGTSGDKIKSLEEIKAEANKDNNSDDLNDVKTTDSTDSQTQLNKDNAVTGSVDKKRETSSAASRKEEASSVPSIKEEESPPSDLEKQLRNEEKEPENQDSSTPTKDSEDVKSDPESNEETSSKNGEKSPSAGKRKSSGKKKRKRGRLTLRPKKSPRKLALPPSYKEESDGEEVLPPPPPLAEDDQPCCKCGQYNHPELILLCDKCDDGYHTACLRPPLMQIPDGDWFCPQCEHVKLIESLVKKLGVLDDLIKKTDRQKRRIERLTFVGISEENIIHTEPKVVQVKKEQRKIPRKVFHKHKLKKRHVEKENLFYLERRSSRAKKQISYRFEEFDSVINSAIQDDIRERKDYLQSEQPHVSGKDIASIERYHGGQESAAPAGQGERLPHPDLEPPPLTVLQPAVSGKEEDEDEEDHFGARKKKRRLNDLGSSSEDSNSSGEEYKGDSDFAASEQEFVGEDEEEEEEELSAEEEDYSDEEEYGRKTKKRKGRNGYSQPVRRSLRNARKRKRRMRDISSDEEDEDDYESGVSSEASNSGYRGRRQRPGYYKGVESSEEEEEQSYSSSNSLSDPDNSDSSDDGYPQGDGGQLKRRKVAGARQRPKGSRRVGQRKASGDSREAESRDQLLASQHRRYEDDSDYQDTIKDDVGSNLERPQRNASKKTTNYRKLLATDTSSSEEEDGESKAEEEEGQSSAGQGQEVAAAAVAKKRVSRGKDIETIVKNADRLSFEESAGSVKAQLCPVAVETFATDMDVVEAPTTMNPGNGAKMVQNEGTETPSEPKEEDDLLDVTDLIGYVTGDLADP